MLPRRVDDDTIPIKKKTNRVSDVSGHDKKGELVTPEDGVFFPVEIIGQRVIEGVVQAAAFLA